MSLKAGIVGLPNVGKSTLFNAITKKNILAANYPFATIDPNVGVVVVPDKRLEVLEEMVTPENVVPTSFEFTDIAGLVKGASKGEGLGNKFLSHIREVDAICEVVRCFDDANITHVEGSTDPIRDIDIINLELIFADLEVINSRIGRIEKKAISTKDKDALFELELMKKIKDALEKDIPARRLEYTEDEEKVIKSFNLLTKKPVIYVANVLENEINEENDYVKKVREYASKEGSEVITLCAKMESELSELNYEDKLLFLEELGIKTELLISSVTKKKKAEILEKLQNGEIDVLIGTHAILEENVVFKNLGLVVTDEQHRFGVKQRGTIASKGQNPDIVAMSATPIPRTLALILYGDLDISIIDELPPNRKKIETYAVRKNMEERVNNFIRKQIKEGRQAYIVCPLVEENEDMEGLQSVIELAERYQKETFSEYKVAYLHGKMKPKEKDEIMLKFKDGEIQILIATTVIEVGVNVPNASIMVVENAERFGLAQLHQLRGRVGRGEYQSYCILKYEGNSETIKQRMKVMCDTNDGFVISEKDLELRGSGDFFGTEQHGLPEFKIANLFEDIRILKRVQGLAIKIMEDDPLLEKEKNEKLNEIVKEKFNSRIEL